MADSGEEVSKKEVDIYRDTPLRYLGYANEVGEAFRALVHVNWVKLSYGVASAYVVRKWQIIADFDPKISLLIGMLHLQLADTNDKAQKMSRSLPGLTTSAILLCVLFIEIGFAIDLPGGKCDDPSS